MTEIFALLSNFCMSISANFSQSVC